ncbi:FtsX-like permease family protein [Actinoplanes sp. N902-109]|uniref:FtsX-like permease family protein n=1 Tax=Actinoplanes sp. (strain N902-109) TaxID=649831 RepID=UPI00032954C7|nr:FtsX-like permease family protein [Actinoplanes sp. N902-109]AGL19834.1 hypothetical protein L083_6324 [Actinoplanes sp. N902-109]
MIGLILGAVRARAAQALTVLVLTALAAAVAVAGPWYAFAAGSRAAAADVSNAPAADRIVSVRQITETSGDPRQALDAFGNAVRGALPLPDLRPMLGMTLALYVWTGGGNPDTGVAEDGPAMSVAYRDDLCDHLRLVGSCPARPGDAVISQDDAQRLHLDIGDKLNLSLTQLSDPVPLRIVGRYTPADPAGAYWSNTLFRGGDGLDPAFSVLDTFTDPRLVSPTLAYDVSVPDPLLRGDGGYDLDAALTRAERAFTDADLRLVNPTRTLLARIAVDRELLRNAVFVALAQVLVLSWFAMGLAGRYTGRDRRGDAALLKLRGSTRGGMLRLAFGQHLVPMLAGVLAGAPLGVLAGWWLGGPLSSADRRPALQLCAAAAAAVLLGGLLVLAAVEIAVLRLPVATLLRRVPPHRRTWRADLLDLVLLAVAAAAAYQARADDTGRGLALVAPALVALAVALLLARVLSRVADRLGGAALRAGRLRLGLTAARISRQPGTDRVFTLVTVAVAILVTTGGGWWAGHRARVERSEIELGAPRVLTVEAASRTALEHAVRTADPGGRQAMAVVADTGSAPPLYAVDSSRLAAVTDWRPEYGDPALLSRAVSTPRPAPAPQVTGDRLTLGVSNAGKEPVRVTVVLQTEDTGRTVNVVLGTVEPGTHRLSAPVDGCTGGSGCRLVRFELGRPEQPPIGADLTVTTLSQQHPARPVLDVAALGDISRWRGDFTGFALQLSAGAKGLTLRLNSPPEGTAQVGTRAYAVDTTLPLPVVLAGPAPNSWQFGDPLLYTIGPGAVPVRVVGTAAVLPSAGRSGFLTDLDAVRRLAGDADDGGTYQVWLAAGAPRSVVTALARAGLTIEGDDTTGAAAARLAEQGTARGAAFALFAAIAAVLLAAATVAVAVAADRGPHLEQLRALRVQGLPRRPARQIGTATGTSLVLAAVLAGLLAAAVAQPIAGHGTDAFTDGWTVIPPPPPLSAVVLAAAGAMALIVFALAAQLPLRRMQ